MDDSEIVLNALKSAGYKTTEDRVDKPITHNQVYFLQSYTDIPWSTIRELGTAQAGVYIRITMNAWDSGKVKRFTPVHIDLPNKIERQKVVVHTDGSCSIGSREGGWAAILLNTQGEEKIIGGWQSETSSNRMELIAIGRAIREVTRPTDFSIFTDSKLCVNWVKGSWARNDETIRLLCDHIEYYVIHGKHVLNLTWIPRELNWRADRYASKFMTLGVSERMTNEKLQLLRSDALRGVRAKLVDAEKFLTEDKEDTSKVSEQIEYITGLIESRRGRTDLHRKDMKDENS